MSNKVFEEAPQASQPSGGAADKLRKAARQLAYDTRYKVKGKFKEGQKTDPASLQRAYMQQLGASSAPGPVKLLAKKMLMGEQYDFAMVESSLPQIFNKVFVEGVGEYVLRVKDPKAGSQYTRSYGTYAAAEAKASELRKKGLRVELANASSSAKKDTYDNKGGGKKDYDGDDTVETSSKEHAGVVHNAIQRKKGGTPDGQDTRKEEVIYEKEENGEEKLDVMKKGKNTIKVNPSLGESIRAELDALKAQRVEEAMAAVKAAGPSPEEKRQLANKDKMLKKKMMLQKQQMNLQRSGRLALNYSEESEGTIRYCPACDKNETRYECKVSPQYWDENSQPKKEDETTEEDPRSMPTKINLAKNKLRAMGLKMSYDMEGDMVEELSVKDQMKVSQEYFKKRNSRSPEEKKAEADKDAKSRAKNYAMHKRPDPYKSRPGESD